METPEMVADRTKQDRRIAEARIRRMVAENLMLDRALVELREHGPRVVTETKGEDE